MRRAANNHLLRLNYNGLTCVTVIHNASLRNGISKEEPITAHHSEHNRRRGNLS